MKVIFLLALYLVTYSCWPTDVPFWPKYPTRTIQVLDGDWDFGFQENIDPLKIDPKKIQTPNKTMVPSSFDVAPPGVLLPRGTAFYRTKISVSTEKNVLLYFSACSFFCSVYVDDIFIGDHRSGGYQPFWLTVPKSTNPTREILVVVDNRFNYTLAPTTTIGDFYYYGGITRNVLVHEQPATTYLQQVETFTVDFNGIIDVNVVLAGVSTSSATLSLSFDDAPPTKKILVPVINGTAKFSKLKVPNSKPWSLNSPNLHKLLVSLYENASVVDSIQVRFGLRKITTVSTRDGARLALNGEVVKFHGINRHTMWPDTGSALTREQILTDVEKLLSLGVNYVRGAHYPQDQRFLDLCDENGIAVWEETLGPGVSTKDLEDEYFLKYQVEAVHEMISASINHPSVILHAFYNEGPSSDPKACTGYNVSASAVRMRVGNPPTRLVTWASNRGPRDVCLDIADVISFNGYPAWYDKAGNLSYIVPYWQNQINWVKTHYPKKAFLISETGAGGIYEWTNKTDPFWSQRYQSEVVQIEAEFSVKSPFISGITIWQFSDIKANDQATKACGQCVYYPHPTSLSVPWNCSFINEKCARPGSENHKGSVDFWRREKMVFSILQNIYKIAKFGFNEK